VSSSRLRSDFWVAAYVRTRHLQGAFAVVSHKGAPEAGAIFVKIDRLDGTFDLYGPAPQSAFDDGILDRQFVRLGSARGDEAAITERLARELRFDSDLWVVDVEDREGRHGLTLAED
jgi:hypothetical protein